MNKRQIGKLGEAHAAQFLKSQNYSIISANYYCRFGEIDLIASFNNQIVFVEVKTRTDDRFGSPQSAITHSKKQKIIKTAFHFFKAESQKIPSSWRIDAIAVKLAKSGKLIDLTHYKNILDG